MPNQETNMLLRNTLAEEGHPVEPPMPAADPAVVPMGYVPRPTPSQLRDEIIGDAVNRTLAGGTEPTLQPFKGMAGRFTSAAEQPAPTPNTYPAVWPLVMVDMAGRDKLGRERYGTPLQPHNGRDALRDAYEEALDLAVYLRTAIYERDGK